jgi:cysteine synthase A
MRCLGAKVLLTDPSLRGTGMVAKAKELEEKHGWFRTKQHDNLAGPTYHANTTAVEILSDFRSERLDYFVSGWGTGGTITGVAKTLKAVRPETKIVCVEPAQAALLQGEPWSSHTIQGWAPNFKPGILEDTSFIDRYVKVTSDEAISASRNLAAKEGIFCGISSGATFAGALELAKTVPEGSHILVMLPDTGERYLTTALWNHLKFDGSDGVESVGEEK